MIRQRMLETAVKPFILDCRSEPVPWTTMAKPLNQCRVALVTTAGVHLKNQPAFDVEAKQGDPSFRELPSSAPADGYRISHTHYDHSDADRDINCVFPVSRVKEMVELGRIGSLAETNFGFMGFIKGITTKINPPRTVAVRFPLGRVTGPPFDYRFQSTVVSDAFEALREIKQPGTILKLGHKYPEGQRDKDCNEH